MPGQRGGRGAPAPRQGTPPPFTLEFFESARDTFPARAWMQGLSAPKKRAIGYALYRVLAQQGSAVAGTEWARALGKGLYEFRLRDEIEQPGVSTSILLRVFFHAYGDHRILLLSGYDKGEHPQPLYQTQQIAIARGHLARFRARQRAEERRPP